MNAAATQLKDDFTIAGWKLFKDLVAEETQRVLIDNERYQYFLAITESNDRQNDQIIGVISIKENYHLFHLFVSPDWQKKGIGKQLWFNFLSFLEENIDHKVPQNQGPFITVNSSTLAIPFYTKLGFVKSQPKQTKKGVTFTPMTFSLK